MGRAAFLFPNLHFVWLGERARSLIITVAYQDEGAGGTGRIYQASDSGAIGITAALETAGSFMDGTLAVDRAIGPNGLYARKGRSTERRYSLQEVARRPTGGHNWRPPARERQQGPRGKFLPGRAGDLRDHARRRAQEELRRYLRTFERRTQRSQRVAEQSGNLWATNSELAGRQRCCQPAQEFWGSSL